jgi:hypothetical protein
MTDRPGGINLIDQFEQVERGGTIIFALWTAVSLHASTDNA